MTWINDAHKELLDIVKAIGLDPCNIPLGTTRLDGDVLTVQEFDLDDDGNKIYDGGAPRTRTRTYRLHPVEPIEEPA